MEVSRRRSRPCGSGRRPASTRPSSSSRAQVASRAAEPCRPRRPRGSRARAPGTCRSSAGAGEAQVEPDGRLHVRRLELAPVGVLGQLPGLLEAAGLACAASRLDASSTPIRSITSGQGRTGATRAGGCGRRRCWPSRSASPGRGPCPARPSRSLRSGSPISCQTFSVYRPVGHVRRTGTAPRPSRPAPRAIRRRRHSPACGCGRRRATVRRRPSSGVKSRGWPGPSTALKSLPGETMWTLCVSVSSLVNRTVCPSAIACTRGTNCKPRWLTRATSAGLRRGDVAGIDLRRRGSSDTTAGLTRASRPPASPPGPRPRPRGRAADADDPRPASQGQRRESVS